MVRFREDRYDALESWNQKILNLDRKFNEELRVIYRYSYRIERKGDLIKVIFGDRLLVFDDPDFRVNYHNAWQPRSATVTIGQQSVQC